MPDALSLPTRRLILAGAGALLASPALAAVPGSGRLAFIVSRNGERIGEHELTFATAGGLITVTAQAAMKFKIGPIGVDYAHQSKEVWTGDAFQSLETSTVTNGKRERVTAARKGDGVVIDSAAGSKTVAAAYAPLSHWNNRVFDGAMFNPQNGKLLKVTVSRSAALLPGQEATPSGARWSLRGQAEIDDWYDSTGAWSALRGRLPDRSIMEYRRA